MSSLLTAVITPLFVLGIVSRVAHLVSAAIIVGGMFYLRAIVVPSADHAETHGDDSSTRYFGTQRRRWGMAIGICTLLLMVSGFYNLVTILRAYQLPMAYHILLTVKLVLAFFIFFAAAIVAGRSAAAERARVRIRSWLNAGLLASLALVGVASTMRAIEHTPKQETVAAVTATPADGPWHLGESMMDKKAKKRLEVLRKKIAQLEQQLHGATEQMDDAAEVERLTAELESARAEATKLRDS